MHHATILENCDLRTQQNRNGTHTHPTPPGSPVLATLGRCADVCDLPPVSVNRFVGVGARSASRAPVLGTDLLHGVGRVGSKGRASPCGDYLSRVRSRGIRLTTVLGAPPPRGFMTYGFCRRWSSLFVRTGVAGTPSGDTLLWVIQNVSRTRQIIPSEFLLTKTPFCRYIKSMAMGRPPLPKGKKREVATIRFSAQDRALIASASGSLTLSEFVRTAALEKAKKQVR